MRFADPPSSSGPGARLVDAVPVPMQSIWAPKMVTGPLTLVPRILATIEFCSQVWGNNATLAPLVEYLAVIWYYQKIKLISS